MKTNLARLDNAPLHGQVATAWTPDSQKQTVSSCQLVDNVANDYLRKELIKQAFLTE